MSYKPAIPASSMTVEQFISDLDELVDAVRERLGRERVMLLGPSWGSALGVLYAADAVYTERACSMRLQGARWLT